MLNVINRNGCCRKSLLQELKEEEIIVERLVKEINNGKKWTLWK